MHKFKQNIKINPNNCAQCLSCMLICSFNNFKFFNPSKAHIQIKPGHFEGKVWIKTAIKFLKTCKPKCWLCAQYCAYGALEHVEE